MEKISEIRLHRPPRLSRCQNTHSKTKICGFSHKGPISKLGETVNYIWGIWIPQSGCKLVDAPDFELYDDRFNPETMSGEFEIYVPVTC